MSNFIETIRKPGEIQALTMDLVKSAKKEIWDYFQLQMDSTDRSVLVLFLWPKKFRSRKEYR